MKNVLFVVWAVTFCFVFSGLSIPQSPPTGSFTMFGDLNPDVPVGGNTEFKSIQVLQNKVVATDDKSLYVIEPVTGATVVMTPGPLSSPVVFKDQLYFYADDGTHGAELWRSDGTPAGTKMVKDTPPGAEGGFSINSSPTVLNDDTMLMSGLTPDSPSSPLVNTSLWKSDGTEQGTTLVKSFDKPVSNYTPGPLVQSGDAVYFIAPDTQAGVELWRSDGTPEGTKPVLDLKPGTGNGLNFTSEIASHKGTVYFTGTKSPSGYALYKTDGTEAGTELIKGFTTEPKRLWSAWDQLIFIASDGTTAGTHGYEVWKSDGTAAGTTMIKDLSQGTSSSVDPRYFYGYSLDDTGTNFFFSAQDAQYNRALYRSDGTTDGTVIYYKAASPNQINPKNMTLIDQTLYYADNMSVWKIPTVQGEAELVRSFSSGGYTEHTDPPGLLTKVGSQLWFVADDLTNGKELWFTGPSQDTTMLRDFSKPKKDSKPNSGYKPWSKMTRDEKVKKFADMLRKMDQNSPFALKTMGVTVYQKYSQDPDNPDPKIAYYFETFGSLMFPDDPKDAWGSTPKPSRARINEATETPFSLTFNSAGEMISNASLFFFTADDGVHGSELWRSDGTQSGTFMLKDISASSQMPGPSNFVIFDNRLFFNGRDGTSTYADNAELWTSDGTPEGTTMLKDIYTWPGYGSSPHGFCPSGSTLFFAAYDNNGTEIWKTDGTPENTFIVKNIMDGISSSDPWFITSVGDSKVFFVAYHSSYGRELWYSDGTDEGTLLVKDIRPGTDAVESPTELTAMKGLLYFVVDDAVNGSELWRSDGTENGTYLVKDIWPGLGSSKPEGLVATVSDTLFFVASNPDSGRELWCSDGTAEGTRLVMDIVPGPGSSQPWYPTASGIEGRLFFTADDGVYGRELWYTVGKMPQSAYLAEDINPGPASSDPSLVSSRHSILSFYADDGVHGSEPWIYNPAPIPSSKGTLWLMR